MLEAANVLDAGTPKAQTPLSTRVVERLIEVDAVNRVVIRKSPRLFWIGVSLDFSRKNWPHKGGLRLKKRRGKTPRPHSTDCNTTCLTDTASLPFEEDVEGR